MLADMTVLTSETFDAFTGSVPSCLVLVFRQACPNCQVLMTVIDKCRPRCPDVTVAGIDADRCPDVLQQAGVTRVPTVLVYRNGELSARRTGVMSPRELLALVGVGSA